MVLSAVSVISLDWVNYTGYNVRYGYSEGWWWFTNCFLYYKKYL